MIENVGVLEQLERGPIETTSNGRRPFWPNAVSRAFIGELPGSMTSSLLRDRVG